MKKEPCIWKETGERTELCAMFFRCAHILRRRVGGRASTTQVLSLLISDSMTQRELQDRLGVQAGSLSELLSSLERRELIQRSRAETDRRRIVVEITEKGKTWLTEKGPVSDEELFSSLSDKERQQLGGMLEKILEAHELWKRERCEK